MRAAWAWYRNSFGSVLLPGNQVSIQILQWGIMPKIIPVEIDEQMTATCGLKFIGCSAFFDGGGEVRVLGELVSANGKKINTFIDIQVIIYDSQRNLIGQDEACLGDFFFRQSF